MTATDSVLYIDTNSVGTEQQRRQNTSAYPPPTPLDLVRVKPSPTDNSAQINFLIIFFVSPSHNPAMQGTRASVDDLLRPYEIHTNLGVKMGQIKKTTPMSPGGSARNPQRPLLPSLQLTSPNVSGRS
jgi:hypothetical protein